jgi:RecB family exonuclease
MSEISSAPFGKETPTPGSPPRAVLDVAASARVLRARRALTLAASPERLVFGRHFVTFRALAERCAGEAGAPLRAVIDDAAVERLVALSAAGIDRFARAIERQPRMAGALVATLRDLRDAGIPPGAVSGDLGALYARTEESLERVAREEGLYDRVGLFRLAAQGAAAWAGRHDVERVEVHGASDLVGSVGDLLQALHAAAPVRVYAPDPAPPRGAERRTRWPWSFDVEGVLPVPDPALRGNTPAGGGSFRILEPSGSPLDELEVAGREVLVLLERGASPSGIGVVMRGLEPYAAWIPVVFGRYGIPIDSSLSTPALLYPEAHSLLDLARALLFDLEREAVVELLASPLFRPKELTRDGVEWARIARHVERIGRRAGVTHGVAQWRRALRRGEALLAGEGVAVTAGQQAAISGILAALEREGERLARARGFTGAVGAILDLADRWMPGDAGASPTGRRALDAARAALAALIPFDAVAQTLGGPPAGPEEVAAGVLRALRGASLRPHDGETDGVQVLDAVQARGVPFQHLLLLGCTDGAWPRPIDDDPFLPDSERSRLRDELRRPVPVRGEWQADERFLLRLLLSQATDTVTISRHSLDGAGRPTAASVYLRELPRVEPDAGSQVLVPLRDALVQAPLEDGPRTLSALAAAHSPDRAGPLERGLDYLAVVEGTSPADLRYDGVIGEEREPTARWSPSHLEGLARCPLQVLFKRVLRIPEPTEGTLHEVAAHDLGQVVHKVLQRLFEGLRDAGHLAGGASLSDAIEQARERLPDLVDGALRTEAGIDDDLGPFRDALRDRIVRALEGFTAAELERLLEEGVEELVCEHDFERPLDVGGSETLVIRGKIDRLVRLGGGALRISDYKSGYAPGTGVAPAEVTKGRALQLPLYVLATADERAAAVVEAEVLATPLRPERVGWRRDAHHYPLKFSAADDVRSRIRPAVETLVALVRAGCYPFRRCDQCRYCPYTLACRREHPPSAERIARAPGFRAYRELSGGRT